MRSPFLRLLHQVLGLLRSFLFLSVLVGAQLTPSFLDTVMFGWEPGKLCSVEVIIMNGIDRLVFDEVLILMVSMVLLSWYVCSSGGGVFKRV